MYRECQICGSRITQDQGCYCELCRNGVVKTADKTEYDEDIVILLNDVLKFARRVALVASNNINICNEYKENLYFTQN